MHRHVVAIAILYPSYATSVVDDRRVKPPVAVVLVR
jgi:hypothetical protein